MTEESGVREEYTYRPLPEEWQDDWKLTRDNNVAQRPNKIPSALGQNQRQAPNEHRRRKLVVLGKRFCLKIDD